MFGNEITGIGQKKIWGSDLFIFNPEYRLRKDKNRIIIHRCKKKYIYTENSPELEKSICFIHPFFAMLISMFDGKTKTSDIAKKFSAMTSLDITSINRIVEKLLVSDQTYSTNFDSVQSTIPQNVIVPANGRTIDSMPVLEDFLIPYDELDHKSRRLNTPSGLMFEINFNCLTDCIYCYADRSKKNYQALELRRILELIQEARKLGMWSFNISGGELFLHPNWELILSALIENDFQPYISTKVPIAKEAMIKLKDLGINLIQLSLDSVDKNELKQILQVNDKYCRDILECLDNLSKFGFKLNIKSQITKFNENSIEHLLKYLLKYQNINRIQIGAAGFSLYKKANSFLPSLAALKRVDKITGKYRKNKFQTKIDTTGYPNFEDTHWNPEIRMERFKKRRSCNANISSFVVLPDGKVTICEELYWHPKFIIGDLSVQSIEEVWNSKRALELYRFSKTEIHQESVCATCPDDEFNSCHENQGVCWKDILKAYGYDNWDYPSPYCPRAPQPLQKYWIE